MAQMYYGTGRRKSSVARVRLIPGTGNVTVNGKALDVYFPMEIVKREVLRPFEVAGCEGKFDVIAKVEGGGFTGMEPVLLVVGCVVAFFVSIFAIKFLMGYIKKNDFKVFGYYRIILGILVLLYFVFTMIFA